METDNVLADDMDAGGPEFAPFFGIIWKTNGGDIGSQRIKPDIHDMVFAAGNFDAPIETGARNGQVFQAAFNDADVVYAAPVYAAGETPIEGVDSDALVEGIKARGHRAAHAVAGADALAAVLAESAETGDMVVCLGAGDITKWAAGLADAIKARRGA